MHLLAFLLTSDLTKAEGCFVCGLGDCLEGSYVFRDWARSWARRTIVQNAIRMLAPLKGHSAVADVSSDPVSCHFARTPEAGYAIGTILRLKDFERFVFVMSVLEKYSDQDCALLLGCSRQDIGETRMRALVHVAEAEDYALSLGLDLITMIIKRNKQGKCKLRHSPEGCGDDRGPPSLSSRSWEIPLRNITPQ
jgi:hypothetical protein